jgi:hypothetical protein
LTYTNCCQLIYLKLEYASPLWAGLSDYLQQEIESVQTRSLKILDLDRDCLPSLSSRRELATIRKIRRFKPNQPTLAIPYCLSPKKTHMNLDKIIIICLTVVSRTERHKSNLSLQDLVNIYINLITFKFVLLTFLT